MAKTTGRPSRKSAEARIRRKNINIDQAKLDRVRKLLAASSETEAVDQALSMLLLREELINGIEQIAGTGGIDNVFEDDVEP
ncbi:MAG: hypothetical protein WD205_01140 [Rhodothermales bacterium]